MVSEGRGELARFMSRLADGHGDPDTVFALRLAVSALEALEREPPALPAAAVVGPTQTGKSTVVNILAAGEHVETSVLAAHTRQAKMLVLNASRETAQPLHDPVNPDAAPAYAFVPDAPACVLWDTPDFDSNAAREYRQQVARICGQVDLIVVVLSKEKYADQSVWRVLETVTPLGTPTVICLNKCEDQAETAILVEAIERRLSDSPVVHSSTPVATLPRVKADELAGGVDREDFAAFRRTVFDLLHRHLPAERLAGTRRLLEANWRDWLAPVDEEIACQREWRELLARSVDAFMARYRSEYIDHARHHDVAQKAVLGLLDLLEIPALAGPLSSTRRVLTWPIRKLASAFGRSIGPGRDQELVVLEAALDHCLLSLRGEAVKRRHSWWRELEEALRTHEPALRSDFHEAVARYRADFQPRIDRLSEELYERLEKHPVTLNTLRAARVSADAGGILLAFKTGTLGLYDALFAPAVVSLTSYVTESAVGQYLRTVIGRLKREQVKQVDAIVRDVVEKRLGELHPSGPGLFGITEGELERARALTRELGP